MLLASQKDLGWSLILNFIISNYLNGTTTCIFWNDAYEFEPQSLAKGYSSFVGINIVSLANSLDHDVVNVWAKKQQLTERELPFNDLLLKLTISIETSHCENFVVFGKDIFHFVDVFTNASMYSIWRSMHNKFVFLHLREEEPFYDNYFFEDQPNILFVVRNDGNDSHFDLKTNKYVGPRPENPAELILLDHYNATDQSFQLGAHLFPQKTRNLQGRELIIACFDYRPYTVIKHNSHINARDIGVPLDSGYSGVYIDGTETQVVLTFCAQFNCTVQIDTSDANDWGTIYTNMSGDGAMGMIINHKADICIGAMYTWYDDYMYLDLSMYLVRSGITCLVPAPRRLASWYLPLQPFQGTLWAAVLACISIEIFGLVLAHRSEEVLYVMSASARDGWLSSCKFAFALTFKLFISQSGNSRARSMTVRVLLFACFLNDIIITSIYGGGLASILTIPSLDEAADTVERLRGHHLHWAANSEAWVSDLRGSDEPLVLDLLQNFHIYNDKQLLDLAQDKRVHMGFAVERLPFGHFAIGDYLTAQTINKMVIMQDDLYYQYTVAFVPRLWPLLEEFNALIYRWHSSGFDKYWEYRIVADNLNVQIQQQVESTMLSSSQEDIGPVTLGMSNFAGIILVWVLGATAASLVFVGELLFAAKFKRWSLAP
ncbi:glutamate [NMDA] receptor subunit 1 [Drosophila tropicalis]|uniref:glutamate [NMDA] receptor subunit 1 n=1 Tax=Drosophila tropicalis TaxID=46794 RepID=UPI0035AC07DA